MCPRSILPPNLPMTGTLSIRIFIFCPERPCIDKLLPKILSLLRLKEASILTTSLKLTAANLSILCLFIKLIR